MKKFAFLLLIGISIALAGTNLYAQQSFTVEIKGKGKPILLFPGFGCSGKMWDETVAQLATKYKCYIYTFAGFGNVKPIDTLWFKTIKNDIEKYIKKHRLKKASLLGHSLGGTLSLWLAADEPKWFNKIILVDALPASAALMIPNYNGEKLPYDNPQSNAMLKMTAVEFQKMNDQYVQFMCNNKEKQKFIADMINESDRKTYVYGYIDMLNVDLRQDIAKIKKNVTILAATSPSLEMVTKTYKEQYKNLPVVNILYAEKSAHFVMYDQPQWFMEQLFKILEN
ncbi:MAG: alpha/beta hydrolase [Microscillaceae bacterium]|jgi:pimeloyl-ACP methyl ester carboxylesterase|nr:alpha/beta hydrolase [Microscillaceae bacterium]